MKRGPSGFSSPQSYTDAIHRRLAKHFGPAKCPLDYRQPHELAIAVILSAQCTDEQVNKTTPDLFARFPNLEKLAGAKLSEIETLIYSTGFYKNKARNIRDFARRVLEDHAGQLPRTLNELKRLPGVGRKTANVIMHELFGVAEGVVVDTHVARLSKILALTDQKDAVKIERELMQKVRQKHWTTWSLYLIFLGRSFCTARKRDCPSCPLRDICPSAD